MKKPIAPLTLAALLSATALPVCAQDQGDFTLGFGVHYVEPTGGDSTTAAGLIDVDGSVRPTLTGEYFIADNIGVELLVAWPFQHDVNLVGAGEVSEVRQLPPTLSVQYHFTNKSKITPFVGAGLNYTHFFDESGRGALAGADVELDDSFGFGLHAGIDIAISDRRALRADIRYIDIDSDLSINGVDQGTVSIDPVIFGVAYVVTF